MAVFVGNEGVVSLDGREDVVGLGGDADRSQRSARYSGTESDSNYCNITIMYNIALNGNERNEMEGNGSEVKGSEALRSENFKYPCLTHQSSCVVWIERC